MNDGSDFLSTAERLMAEAQLLGAVFQLDGSWAADNLQPPLPSALTDRLRVHRGAIAAVQRERTAKVGQP